MNSNSAFMDNTLQQDEKPEHGQDEGHAPDVSARTRSGQGLVTNIRDFLLGNILARHGRFFTCLLLFTLGVRFALVQWALSGGFPTETIMANILCAIASGIPLGLVEGRVSTAHQQRQQVLGIELSLFVRRFRLAAVSGVFAALVLATLLDVGAIISSLADIWSILWAFGVFLLALAVGLMTLWFSFSWARWCFGEARWN